jgi:zinc D-Ala-D-Ala carboxypeptidase
MFRAPRSLRRFLTPLLTAVVAVGALTGPPPAARAATFSDIAGSSFVDEIQWLAAEGITTGCGGARFCPRAPVTRAEMAAFLVRLFGYSAVPAEDPFDDDDGTTLELSINRLVAAGITSGCGPRAFCPTQVLRREQMAAFLANVRNLTYGAGSDHFGDDDGSPHELDLDRIQFAGIGGACAAQRACPRASVLREQMAAFLYRTVHAAPIGTSGLSQQVAYPEPREILLDGPRRFRGVSFSADRTTVLETGRFGTIPARTARIDRSAVVNAVRYGRVVDGPLAGSWVKVDGEVTKALGRAPAPPTCTYADLPTTRTAYTDHAITLLDTVYRLPSTYAPSDLVSTTNAGLNAGYSVRSLVIADLRAMADAARAAGGPLRIVSAYRSYAQQASTFDYWVSVGGYEQALRTSARAGHSEHQLGTTVDVTSLNGAMPWEYADWAQTIAGAWIAAHAWEYGFLVSYPRSSFEATCYDYEPWHLRYVGREIANAVRDAGMTLREAVWAAHGP